MSNKFNHLYEFDDYLLNPRERNLWRGEELIQMPPKVFDTLCLLVEKQGEVVSKDEMLDTIWEDAFVEENNLSQNISALRKIFGKNKQFIQTVPTKGFCFSSPVRIRTVEGSGDLENTSDERNSTLARQIRTQVSEDIVEESDSDISRPRKKEDISSAGRFVDLIRTHNVVSALIGLLVLGSIFLIYQSADFRGNNSKQINSIAVMPFINESENNEDAEYLSDGMTESLIGSLSRIPNLSIKARSSVFRYKGKEMDPKAISRELGVEAVLLGRVAQRGDDVSLNLELVDAGSENILWAEKYNRKMVDLVALQTDITRDVTEKMRITLTPVEKAKITKRYTENSEAHVLYLKGRYFWNKRDIESLQKSVGFFNAAIEKDPEFALAFSGLADSYALFPPYGGFRPKEYMPRAKQAAVKALELDNTLAEAHASLGQIIWNYEHDWDGAEREYKTAIKLNPNYSTAHQWYGELLSAKGLSDEGLKELKIALSLDPLSLVGNEQLGKSLLLARRYDQAITQLKQTLQLNPKYAMAYFHLGECYVEKGMFTEAIEAFSAVHLNLGLPEDRVKTFRDSFRRGGFESHHRKFVAFLVETRKNDPTKRSVLFGNYSIALTYARLSETDKAIAHIERGISEREPAFLLIKVHPAFDNLRKDNRFDKLIEKIGLS